MSVRDHVTFRAEFPSDARWDEGGNLLVPGGKRVAETIRHECNQRGFTCTEVHQHCDYGWEFDVTREGSTIWCLVTDALTDSPDEWLLRFEKCTPALRRLIESSTAPSVAQFQDSLQEILTTDRRFTKVLWYSKSDYEARNVNAASPTPR